MGKRINFTKEKIIKLLKKANKRSDFYKNTAAKYYLRSYYPELIEQFFPSKNNINRLKKCQDRKDYITKQKLIKEMKKYKTRSVFSKRNPILLNFSKKYYPEVLNKIFPLKTN